MRYVTFVGDGPPAVGVLHEGDICDLSELYPSTVDLIAAGAAGRAAAEKLISTGRAPRRRSGDVRLAAPVARPRRDVFAVGLNYRDHLAESVAKAQVGDGAYPSFFVKATGSVIGPGEEIGYPLGISEQLDYEAEVAVVIGIAGRGIPVSDAAAHVFGYTLANDVTVRDVQRRHGNQWNKGKSFDRSCPLGPAIVTSDEVDLANLTLECEVNGEPRQKANLSQLIFSVPELVAELSVGMTLLPGDVILTGTPSGVGYARKPPQFLRPGDRVVVRSNQLGELANPVGRDLGPLVGV